MILHLLRNFIDRCRGHLLERLFYLMTKAPEPEGTYRHVGVRPSERTRRLRMAANRVLEEVFPLRDRLSIPLVSGQLRLEHRAHPQILLSPSVQIDVVQCRPRECPPGIAPRHRDDALRLRDCSAKGFQSGFREILEIGGHKEIVIDAIAVLGELDKGLATEIDDCSILRAAFRIKVGLLLAVDLLDHATQVANPLGEIYGVETAHLSATERQTAVTPV